MPSTPWSELLTQAQEAGKIPPPGDYVAVVEHAEFKKTQAGKDMISVRYRIVSGPEQNKALFDNMVISPESPNAMSFFFTKVASLGLDPASFSSKSDDQIAAEFVGKVGTLTVSHREWPKGSGQMRTQVDGVSAAPAGFAAAAAADTPPPAAAPAPVAEQPAPAPSGDTPPPAKPY